MRNALILACLLSAATLNAATKPVPPVVNVNTATVQQLQFLPGVGKVMAARIIVGRPYANPGSLLYVKGIKDAKLKAMFRFVVTSGATTAAAKIVTCKVGETGVKCQARVGNGAEVIQYPNGALVIESK